MRSNYEQQQQHSDPTMTTLDSQSDKCCPDKRSNADSGGVPSETVFPDGVSPLSCQVAGHTFDEKKNTVGVLRGLGGQVLKPAEKPLLGEREIEFYENLESAQEPALLQLKNFVPKYHGTQELHIYGRRVKFLVLKDITEGMTEPCVMDIKIGRRTWDPSATPQKRAREEQKYAEVKRIYGFCITGFQVYSLAEAGQLKKYGNDYAKKLDAKGVVDALDIFLNVTADRVACRQLIVRLLSVLWKILAFFRTQRKLRFYSSSLLVAYDARRLRHCLRQESQEQASQSARKTGSFSASGSLTSLSSSSVYATSNNPPLSSVLENWRIRAIEKTHALKRSISLTSTYDSLEKEKTLNRSGSGGLDTRVDRLCRTHSFANNFDDDIVRMKEDYDALLNELSASSEERQNWVRVNMIDFTHVFPADDQCALDLNYLEGIESLIKLVESYLDRKDVGA